MPNDLTTTKGGDLPEEKELTTPTGSNNSFEVEGECSVCGKTPTEHKNVKDHNFKDKFFSETDITSVSGPPADSNMNVIDDEVTVLPSTNENLTDEDLTKEDLTSDKLGEGNSDTYGRIKGEPCPICNQPLNDVRDSGIKAHYKENHPDVYQNYYVKKLGERIMFNENYIVDQFGEYYRPVYIGENIDVTSDDILIFENKYYTTEGLGNCVFCQGAGKVTVERLGLKDCPDCDGTGDVQSAPTAQPQLGQNPDAGIPQPTIPQQPNISQPNIQPQQKQPQQQPNIQPPQKLQTGTPSDATIPPAKKPEGELPPKPEEKPKTKENISNESKERMARQWWDENPNKRSRIPQSSTYKDKSFDSLPQNLQTWIVQHYDSSEESISNESFKNVVRACGCKDKARESINNYKKFIDQQINILKKRAKSGEAVSLMYGLPTISREGRKIKGTLAYAGVSLNDRIYLPEELAKGHERRLPLLLNHSSTAGAEKELDRLSEVMLDHLYNEKDYQVGEVVLNWDPEKLTLFYEGVVNDKFFQKEIDDMDMAVSLGIYYDSDSPKICDESCYTVIKGAEFREVSLVYHAGFPIATIEAVEAELKQKSLKAMEDHFELLNKLKKEEEQEGEPEHAKDVQTIIDDIKDESTEELDVLQPNEQPIDVEEKQKGEPLTIDINEDTPIIAEALTTMHNFSVRGVAGMTISNSNGVERYRLDPNMSYETNMIHFDVSPKGANIYGEAIQMQPKMTTPPALTKEIEKKPDIKFTDADEDVFKKKR